MLPCKKKIISSDPISLQEAKAMSSLPEEIQVEIFIKLPANSILVCKCVCKIWHTLLCNPKFVKTHLIHTIQTNKNPRLILSQTNTWSSKNPSVYSIDYASVLSSASSLSVSTSLSLSIPTSDECACEGALMMDYPLQHRSIYSFQVLGSWNGLICISMADRNVMHLCIWNPTTREYKELSQPQYYDSLGEVPYYRIRYGFGYDSIIDDYKVVRISGYVKSPDCFKMQVYRLGSGSWDCIKNPISYTFHRSISCGLLFHGALHWIGKASSEVIISFDISNERLLDVPLPEVTMEPPGYGEQLHLSVLGDCLCLAVVVEQDRLDVWVMQDYGVGESWAKFFTITDDQSSITGFEFFKPIWSFENHEILINTGKELVLYDQVNGRIRKVYFPDTAMTRNEDNYLGNIESYVESLVPLKSGTYVEKRTAKFNNEATVGKIW